MESEILWAAQERARDTRGCRAERLASRAPRLESRTVDAMKLSASDQSMRMPAPIRILVFPCGTEIGLEIHQALCWSKHIELIGASSVDSNHGKFVYRHYIGGVPFIDEPRFLDSFRSLIAREKIDLIFPAHDSVNLGLARVREKLSSTLIGSPLATIETCRVKSKTYALFEETIRVPKMYGRASDIDRFPVFLKPDVGEASRGVHLARSLREVEFYLASNPGLLILEYLPGKEYTVDCFTDRKGHLHFVGARERVRIQNGISVNSKAVDSEDCRDIARAISARLTLRGAWFFQVKEGVDGGLGLLEIGPRVAGTMSLYRAMGVNFPLLTIYDALGRDVVVMVNTHENLEVDRALASRFCIDFAFRHVYVDLDDTIIVGDEVNAILIAFLYQSFGRGITLHLLTKHRDNIWQTLDRHRLRGLFDSVTVLDEGSSKPQYIAESDAIYIDDSFSERIAVRSQCGIPVFDVDAIPYLIDWRR